MEKLTGLGEVIVSDNSGIKYDRIIKNVLAFKPILARIFKETVAECEHLSYEEIEQCIEGDIEIDIVGLNPNTNSEEMVKKIEGKTQEDIVSGEGKITFDIRTVIRIPKTKETVGVKLLVDVEAQKDDTPGYDISERAIFYCSRMISAQLDTEFSNRTADTVKYGNLKKVYSIWICMESAQCRANTIERYTIKRDVYPKEKADNFHPRYDLMEAVIVNISAKHDDENSESSLIQMLTDLFDETMDSTEKIHKLKEDYGIPTTVELEEEVANMTAFAANLIAKGEAQGMAQGMAQGEAKLAKLVSVLLAQKRTDDIERATGDEAYRQKLYKELNITE